MRSSVFLPAADLPLLLLIACVVAGCTRSRPVEQPVAGERPVVRTASGEEMTLVAAGEFIMGDSLGSAEELPHRVRVDSFYMDCYPISQEIYHRVTGQNPSKRKRGKNPVETIQWTDAARFCNLCSEREGLTPCYDLETWVCNFDANGYRLPTEAEWEYACRAGSQARYFFGDDDSNLPKYAWCKPHSKGRPRSIGEKLPNPWGLHDMAGNVWEWCNDYYDAEYYSNSPPDNPTGPTTGKKRVLRGGAWNSPADQCRSATRFSEFQVFTDACFGSDSYGFRRVRQDSGTGDLVSASAANLDGDPLLDADPMAVESDATAAANPNANSALEANQEAAAEAISPTDLLDAKRLTGTVVFVSDRGGALDIWSMTVASRIPRQLTSDSHSDADPRFSPSGERIMYTTLRDGFPQIWTMDVNGSDPQFVTAGSQANWSPDGRSIVFIRDDQAVIRELETGDEKRVTPSEWRRCGVPTWSPDGSKFAVASRHLERIGIFVFTLDTSEYDQLQTEDACCTPQWSNDGNQIVFQTDKGHIHLHYSEDGTEEQVTFGADVQHDARFSPDGSMIVYCRAPSEEGPWQLWITDLESDGLETMQITTEGSNRLPDWHR